MAAARELRRRLGKEIISGKGTGSGIKGTMGRWGIAVDSGWDGDGGRSD
jgi:hypothetical protein